MKSYVHYFDWRKMPEGLRDIAEEYHDVAWGLYSVLGESDEVEEILRLLLVERNKAVKRELAKISEEHHEKRNNL